jgi:hypothetical protein
MTPMFEVENPIEEIWRIREEIGAEHDYDVDKLFSAMREKQTQYGDRLVHHVPRDSERKDDAVVLRDQPPSRSE